jgi:hypothetical protein
MSEETTVVPIYRASPIVERQYFVSTERPSAPPSFLLADVDGIWIAYDQGLPAVELFDAAKTRVGVLIGHVFSEFDGGFLPSGAATVPVEIKSAEDLETQLLPRLSGTFFLLTAGRLPRRIYPDHGGTLPMVYMAESRAAASSPAVLLDPAEYRDRFLADLHKALVVREGAGGWISGTLTAHRGVYRLLPNHFLDLDSWTTHRFWPRPGEFDGWRDFAPASDAAAAAIRRFTNAVCDDYTAGVSLTAGFDTRLVAAGCRERLSRCNFFTVDSPAAEMDVDRSRVIAQRFGLTHRVMPMRQASAQQMAIWDRMVGDCVLESPRLAHPTLRDLNDCDVLLTGLFGEIGRCRYYRQDYLSINDETIDARFVLDRLTVPAHPTLLENVDVWFRALEGQPNSVILDLALCELKLGCWGMSQRAITNSIKLTFMPFVQRAVFDAFIGVSPAEKDTKTLFWALIGRLWPELSSIPINKYGDVRDYLYKAKKITNPVRVRRFLRDRLAKKAAGAKRASA